jgi:putative spermidine/putrescine transport system permease protein
MTATTAAATDSAATTAAHGPPREAFPTVRQFYWLLIMPATIAMIAFYFYPLSKVLWISVTEPEFGLGNYKRLLTSESIHQTLLATLRISVITTSVTLVLGYIVAYAMVQATSGWLRWIMFCVLLPLWISVLVRAFAWVTLLRDNGVINNTLMDIGVIDGPLPLLRNELSVCIGMIHYMLPFAVMPLYSNMKTIDLRLIAAARALGAPPFTAFRKIFFPLSLPGLFASGVLVFIFSMGFYVTPALLGGGRVFMVAEYIGLQITQTIQWGTGTMLATVLLIAVLTTLIVLGRFVNMRKLFGAA